uniref:Fucosyltransferase n=1 Tax=Nothobranchius pienaari TaxID=704102 RepID=A0A1A8MIE6_9TELE
MNYESPSNTDKLWHFEGMFNLTMSYRMDSDIFLPYGYLFPQARANALSKSSHSTRPRDQFIAWVISNWSAAHARVTFYHKLRRFVRIDLFGGAGRPLPRGNGTVVRLLKGYMFYLALENSQHTDYITEKLWNALMAGAVPVVLGPSRRNYERFLPPKAFIHVDDFPTVKKLAQYLLKLWRDPIRARRHLDWRGGYSLHQPKFWDEHYCTACRAARRTRGQSHAVKHLARWFFS